jgi:hypothetical protein
MLLQHDTWKVIEPMDLVPYIGIIIFGFLTTIL